MTRYARSAGMSGQSKTIHSGTPWSQLKPKKQNDDKKHGLGDKSRFIKKKNKRDSFRISHEPLTLPPPKPPKASGSEGIAAEIEKVPQKLEDTKKDKKIGKKKSKFSSEKDSGFSSLKQSVDKIKYDLAKEGKSLSEKEETEMRHFMNKAEKSEHRRLKRAEERDSQKVCFKCRGTGHDMASCPKGKKDREAGTGICFKCGSTEHSVHQCRVRLPPGEYPYAKCFICGESGHLSKQCPDNPRGLYPNGGCCKFCGSVEHFMSSCPEMLKQQGVQDYKLHTWTKTSSSADDDLMLDDEKPKSAPKAKLKVVKF